MNRPIRALLLFLACALSTVPALAGPTHYRGLCDASAAAPLGPSHFVVADDDHDILTIYQRGKPDPIARVDLIDYLGNRQANGKARKADIEGAARIGNRIYWIGSHGRNSKGKVEDARQRFFATDVVETPSGATLRAPNTPPYRRLIADLMADPRFAVLAAASALEIPPEASGGFNIEGLAATPEGHLLIGFRNPLPAGRALLVSLKNPAEVIEQAATPVFGDLIALDLGGRGIRSIDLVDSRYLIVAGPFDDGKHSGKGFALFAWSGGSADSPQRVKGVDFGSMHPEALFAAAGKNEIYLLSDDGNDNCKKQDVPADRKSFRGLSLSLPDFR